jgi:hypothetical protein
VTCRSRIQQGGAIYHPKGRDQKLKKLDIIVIRVNTIGRMFNSRPCSHCLNMMKSTGIRRVHYSNELGEIVTESVKDMISIQTSSISRMIDNNIRITVAEYSESLLKNIPNIMKKINFEHFVKYNMSNVLPNHSIIIQNSNVSIFNPSNNVVVKIQLKI